MRIHTLFFCLLLVLFPTQVGRHFWPEWSSVFGIRVDYLSPTIFLTDIVLLLLLFFWFLEKPFKGVSFNKGDSLVFFLLIFLVVSSFLAERSALAFYKLVKLVEFCLFGFYVSKNVVTKKHFTLVVFFLTLGIFWSSFLAWAQFLSQSSLSLLYSSTHPLIHLFLQLLGERTFDIATPGVAKAALDSRLVLRPYATFPHPNALAGFMVVVFVLVISNFRLLTEKRQKLSTVYYLLSTIVASATIFISFSRTAWTVWLLVISYWLLVKERRVFFDFLKKKKIVGFLIGFLVLVFVYYFSSVVFYRFSTLKTDDLLAVSRRLELNKASFKMIRFSPIFGIGLGNLIPRLFDFSQNREVVYWLQPAHNIFLLIAAETGLVGLGLFLWFLFRTFQRTRNSLFIIHYSLFAILALGLFDHYFLTLQQTQLLFPLVLGLCWSEPAH